MKLIMNVEYLPAIELGRYEHVTVVLTSGVSITVFDDVAYVATKQEREDHKDGKRIWVST